MINVVVIMVIIVFNNNVSIIGIYLLVMWLKCVIMFILVGMNSSDRCVSNVDEVCFMELVIWF